MDPIAGRLLRRYLIAGLMLTAAVIAGVFIGQRQHIAEFPAKEALAVPCAEACAKRIACGDAAGSATRCQALCHARASQQPREIAAQARCIVERGCAELAACGGSW